MKKTKRKTRKERQRLYDNRLPVKDTKSRPKSAEQVLLFVRSARSLYDLYYIDLFYIRSYYYIILDKTK